MQNASLFVAIQRMERDLPSTNDDGISLCYIEAIPIEYLDTAPEYSRNYLVLWQAFSSSEEALQAGHTYILQTVSEETKRILKRIDDPFNKKLPPAQTTFAMYQPVQVNWQAFFDHLKAANGVEYVLNMDIIPQNAYGEIVGFHSTINPYVSYATVEFNQYVRIEVPIQFLLTRPPLDFQPNAPITEI